MAVVTAAAIGVAGVAASAYAANRASSAADKDRKQRGRAENAQIELGREQMEEGNRRFGEWEGLFMPGFESLRDMAMEQQRPDYASVTADVGAAFDSSRDINERNMQRYGVNPTDGATSAANTQYGIGRALAMVGGRTQARNTARDGNWNRMSAFANSGNSLYQGANSMINSAYSGMNSAFGQQAANAGNNARFNQGRADAAWNDVGTGIGYIGGRLGSGGSTSPSPSGGGEWGAFGPGGGNWTGPGGG